MRGFGLIGYPLTHSFSKKYFTEKFRKEKISDCFYEIYPLTGIEGLKELIRLNYELEGLNVTIPHKESVIDYLDRVDPDALSVGAVNTIKISRDSDSFYLEGYNTDVYGFQMSIQPLLKHYHKKALILGTGGASKAVANVFRICGIDYLYVSRKPYMANHISYKEINDSLLNDYLVIINTTPSGMYPDVDSFPDLPYDFITDRHLLFDLIYNPGETQFLKKGRLKGAVTMNGLSMLHLQAEKSWEIWNA